MQVLTDEENLQVSCFEACPGLAAVSAKTQPPEENQPGEQ